VKGTPEQLASAVSFLSQMVSNGWVGELTESMAVAQAPVRDDFVVLKSTSKHVVTGEHSDVKLDEVESTTSADKPYHGGAYSAHEDSAHNSDK
jgi:hypothetical protein